jgi:N-acetylmuramoyl-L-alanine amidase
MLLLPLMAILLAGCASEETARKSYLDTHPPMHHANSAAVPDAGGTAPQSYTPEWTPPPGPPAKVTGKVVLDAGHGGKDPGTHSAAGIEEKSINLAVALAAAQYLRDKGIEVVLTRKDDTFVELAERTAIATRSRAQLFVSIHADYSKKSAWAGHTILLPQDNSPEASRLATLISGSMVTAGSAQRSVRQDDRGLWVLKHADCPSILVELGFLSNKTEAASLSKASTQASLGKAIAEGILQYFQSQKP